MSSEQQPTVAQKAPYAMDLKAGTYFWCSCGNSSNQPWCDGAHKGTSFVPEKIVVEEDKTMYLCGCKHSGKNPFCDGSHSKL